MDLFCPVCGEPWSFDVLHEEAQQRYGIPLYVSPDAQGHYYGSPYFTKVTNDAYNSDDYQRVYKTVTAEFRTKGCKALTHITEGQSCYPIRNAETQRDRTFGLSRSEAAGALYDILGDDLDGAATMLEDMGF